MIDTEAPQQTVAITAESVDPLFNDPYIEVNELRSEPVPHRYVHGGFRGTNARFSFYFPPAETYEGRFFHNTYPMATSADIGPFPIAFEVAMGDLAFTLDSGAYYVQTNNGGVFRAQGVDPAIPAYRVNAAAAKHSRVVAAEVYGDHRPWGYLFGGSGGAYQTMGAAENTSGVWDGFVPFVPGCNHAIPSMFTVRMHALRVLRQRDRFPAIADAMEPGGSADPYAGLSDEEAAALREVSLMGYPLSGWYCHEALDSGYFSNISGMIPVMDPTYVEDFWSKPGYLGSDPESSIHADRFQFETSVVAVDAGAPVRVWLSSFPDRDFTDSHLMIVTGAAAGASLPIAGSDGKAVTLIAHLDPSVIATIQPGDRVRIDNSWPLALQTYHRHQVPPTDDYYGWNQFRDAPGKPIYPQRDVLVGPTGTANAAGSVLTGRVNGKVLTLACLMDIDSFPWQADWYRSCAETELGTGFHDNFAVWFIDHAHHENPMTPLARAHVVSYGPVLKQALRDLAAWVETGVRPSETAYRVVETQIVVPVSAAERRGVQPVVELTADGAARAEAKVGEPVSFHGVIEAPPGAGKVVAAEWDFEGSGDYSKAANIAKPELRLTVTASHTYASPGIYFAVLRGTSQRDGDVQTPHCRIQNLGRVRVIVS
jgi:hypothetical protein